MPASLPPRRFRIRVRGSAAAAPLTRSVPNNFGATLLLASGLLLTPLVLGVPLLLLGLAMLRDARGEHALPALADRLRVFAGLRSLATRSPGP